MAFDVYLDSKSAVSEEDIVVLRKLAPSIAVFSRVTSKRDLELKNKNDDDLSTLFVSKIAQIS